MVTIIVPAYNAAPYLRETLESVKAQSFTDWECIVVDDGSTDSTLEIAESFRAADPRFRVVTRPNGGLSAARNTGLDNAQGEWICFVDADDTLFPHSLRHLMELTRYGRLIVGGAMTRVNAHTPRRDRKINLNLFTPEQALSDLLYQRSLLPSASAKLYHCSLFMNESFREGILYEDIDIMYRLIRRSNGVALSDETVYYYRVTPGSLTERFTPRRLDVLAVTERMEQFIAAHYPALLPAARSRRLSAAFNMFGLLASPEAAAQCPGRAEECFDIIRRYRADLLRDRNVRLKNRLGILVSYLGPTPLKLLSRIVYR